MSSPSYSRATAIPCNPRSITRPSTLSCNARRFGSRTASSSALTPSVKARRSLSRELPPSALDTADDDSDIPASFRSPDMSCAGVNMASVSQRIAPCSLSLTDSLSGHAKDADEEKLVGERAVLDALRDLRGCFVPSIKLTMD